MTTPHRTHLEFEYLPCDVMPMSEALEVAPYYHDALWCTWRRMMHAQSGALGGIAMAGIFDSSGEPIQEMGPEARKEVSRARWGLR